MGEKVLVSHGMPVYPIPTCSHGEWTKNQTAAALGSSSSTEIKGKVVKEEASIEERIRRCWSEVESKCVAEVEEASGESKSKRSGWKAVRLFVSSTFHDYHSEREVLVKKVFPELREWCVQRQLHLIECDLRWGVPKDSTTAAVLCTCMDEIGRCHGDTNGQGMFLNMLGERYGWIPSVTDIPPDLAVQYQWVHDTSITSMEIMLGAYFRQNRNAAFFIRNPDGWLGKMPKKIQNQFVDPAELGREQLKVLKSKLREKFPDQCFDYDCYVDDPEQVTGRPELKGLDDFGNQVLSFFKEAIAREYPVIEEGEEDKPGMREEFSHRCTLEQKGAMVVGRGREYDLLIQYAQGEISEKAFAQSWSELTGSEESKTEEEAADEGTEETQENSDDDHQNKNVIAVIAEPGAGKSSLLAKCAIEARKINLDTFIHFVGCSGVSTSHANIIKRLSAFLLAEDDPRMEKLNETEESNVHQSILDGLLEERKQSGKKLLILIDDLSQLTTGDGFLDWLPQKGTAANITIVVTMVQGDGIVDTVRGYSDRMTWVNLGHLTDSARYDIVANYFKRYNKTLDPEQTKLVVESEGAKNALWLSMACEELRVFGVFELLTKYIKELPSSLDALLETILTRLVKEDETNLVKQTLCFMECAREGLREQALQTLLGDLESKEPVPMLHWAMVNRTLKPFIRVSSNYQQLDQLTFYHHAIGKAVRSQWLADKEVLVGQHRKLADYFQHHCTDAHLLARESAYHMNAAGDGDRLLNFIRKDERSRYIDAVSIARYIKEYKCRTMIPRGPKMNVGGAQLYCCQFCANMRQGFCKRQMFPNKDSCVLCGQFVPFKKPENFAYWCGHHPKKGFYPGMNQIMCHVCRKPIMMKGRELPLYLCQFCRSGLPTCCRTKID